MNFNKAGKYLSLTLLVLAILSTSVGISVAAGENSSSAEAVDFNNYTSYYNYSSAVNVDHKPTSNLTKDLSDFNTNGISFNLNNHNNSSDEDSIGMVYSVLSNEDPVNLNVSQAFSEHLFNVSGFDKYWDELIELEFGSHKFRAIKLIISNPLKNIHKLNKKVQKNSDFENFNKNLLDNFSTVDLYKNELYKNKYILINKIYIFNSKNNSKIYASKLPIQENHSSDDNDNDEDELSDSINLGIRFISYFNSFKTSNEFYKILDNTNSHGKLIHLESSNFNILGSYSIIDYFSNEIKNKYTVVNENRVKNNNSLFYIFNSKNNSKIHANKLPITDNHSSYC
ncbi:hypothetical protein [Methanobrevibacter curvatus]|uniref:Uncharacterized protein n=1 Tax=Methanobrevibacter curvatus TaxID=49547 RepID=A0A166DXI3_9EURY|nr:hypothetical protein [Methanobrevibacter curvatus]KZX16056.1 hypothetical protein MBCUR_01240 [Methanobrevibacter curvatus]